MKLASFHRSGVQTYGIVAGNGVIDLGARLGERYPGLRDLLAGQQLDTVRALAVTEEPDVSQDEITWLPVVPDPSRIICIGLNYRSHVTETARSMPSHPVTFIRFPSSQTAHKGPIVQPKVSGQLDFEGELALIIGAPGRYVDPKSALRHVAGYSIYNDASVRDWQKHSHQYTPGKNFPSTGAFGPWMVTSDEIPDPTTLTIQTRLNGNVMQQGRVSDLIFSIPTLIEYVSSFTELSPGDVIVTGTPEGVGAARNPPVWLMPGDEVEVTIEGIGTLRNTVTQEH